MRRCNAILSMAILALFLAHAILGAFQLLGSGSPYKVLSWVMAALVAAHIAIGCKLTYDSLRVWKKTGVAYFKENKLFWTRRVSGFAVMILLLFHVMAFGHNVDGAYRLREFTSFRLATQLLLVAALAVHIITNVKPMLISFGIKGLKQWAADILFVLSVLLLFMAVAFIIYYLRWNVF